MSILIKGMEMPKSCDECRFFDWHKGMGNFCNIDESIKYKAHFGKDFEVMMEKIGDCPLIEVPPHGRLIDADALTGQMERNLWAIEDKAEKELGFDETLRRGMQYGHAVCLDAVNATPTIIEAEDDYSCSTCRFNPPSSCDGKPCTVCDTSDPLMNCYQKAEVDE